MSHNIQSYNDVSLKDPYSLQNAGGLVFVCTKGAEGRYDLAPVAWVECSVSKTIVQGTSGVVFGKALKAKACEDWWK